MKQLFKRFKPGNAPLPSYAQSGEDILAHKLLCRHLKIKTPVYVDIGAHDPVHLSNTYLFYKLGCTGLLVEPDPDFANKLRRKRPKDTLLPAGISADGRAHTATFYRLNQPTLNTFSREEAEQACRLGPYRIIEEKQIPVLPINAAIEQHLKRRPNFLSIDAEGLDLAILGQYDFDRLGPEVICVESADFCENNIGPLRADIFVLMDRLGYFLHSSTYLNGLFVSRAAWQERIGDPPRVTLAPAKPSNSRSQINTAA